jgi:selenocysteine lyase/cysteine desulfurase
MVGVPLPPCDAKPVQRRLLEEYRIEVLLQELDGIPLVRVSVQAYNGEADVDRLVAALGEIFS